MDAGCWQALAQQVVLQLVSTTLGLNKHQGQTLQDKTNSSSLKCQHFQLARGCWQPPLALKPKTCSGCCSCLIAICASTAVNCSNCSQLPLQHSPARMSTVAVFPGSCYSRPPSSRSPARSRASGPAAHTPRAGQSGLWSYPHDRLSGKCSRAGSLQTKQAAAEQQNSQVSTGVIFLYSCRVAACIACSALFCCQLLGASGEPLHDITNRHET